MFMFVLFLDLSSVFWVAVYGPCSVTVLIYGFRKMQLALVAHFGCMQYCSCKLYLQMAQNDPNCSLGTENGSLDKRTDPEGPHMQDLGVLVPKTAPSTDVGTRNLELRVSGPCRSHIDIHIYIYVCTHNIHILILYIYIYTYRCRYRYTCTYT